MQSKTPLQSSIELTRKQYLALLKAVYLGNWMVNAQRDGGPLDPLVEEYEDIADFVFSLAPRFGLEKYLHRHAHESEDDAHHHPTRLFEEGTDVRAIVDAYDEGMFWEELAERLGERDFHAAHPEEAAAAMSEDEYLRKHGETIDRYEDEFAEHGIDRLRVAEEKDEKRKGIAPRLPAF